MTRNETKPVKTEKTKSKINETDNSAVIVIASDEYVINTLSRFIPKERVNYPAQAFGLWTGLVTGNGYKALVDQL